MTFDKVIEIISDKLSMDKAKLSENTVLGEELGADSLDLVEILMALEDEFGVSIPDEVLPELRTVKDLVEYIDKNKQ